MVKIELGKKYRFLNLSAGTYLTCSSEGSYSAIGHAHIDNPNQVWTFEDAGPNNVYFIKSVGTSKYLAVPTGHVVEKQQLNANSPAFGWRIQDQHDMATATTFAAEQNTGLYIDLDHGNTDDGTPVILYERMYNNQIWLLEKQ